MIALMYEGLQMDIFIRELKSILETMIVKRNVEAEKYETVEILQEAEMYVMVKDGIDDFTSYSTFHFDVYMELGIPPAKVSEYGADKNKIPYNIRSALVKLERKYILEHYEEKNNYYRRLSGMPDYEDTDKIYAPENDIGISTDIEVYKLDRGSIGRLISSGLMAKLKEKYPDKLYLNYVGDRAIDWYTARKALNYEMLFIRSSNPDNIATDFKKFYSNAREYYMIAVYNNNIMKAYKYYDNFIGLCILLMAIQRMFSSVFHEGIARDFYDTQIIRYLFDSYSVPYIEDMTIDQMKLLAKNLNIFLSFKSSDRVLFDLCAVFGFTNVSIYKYLLVRNHIHSSQTGKPIFPKKTVVNSDGTITEGPDYESMFDIYFQKVNMKTKDINTALVDMTNRMEYNDMTVGDIYWVDDEKLREKIYTAELNYIESKYISIDVMFKITAMMYEISHFFRMVIDNNQEFRKAYVLLPKVSSKAHDLYSIIIFLCAFFCKRYGFTGEIPLKPAATAYVYGFNFHADMAQIIADVIDSKYLDEDVIQYMLNFSIEDNRDVDRIYRNIKTLKDFVVEQMAMTKNIYVYRAYKKFYNSILVIEDKETVYKKNDGTYANDYFELLRDLDPELYFYLDDFDVSDSKYTDEIMIHVLYKLETLCDQLKYLHTAVDASALVAVLLRLINFFKSYTVDLSHAGILYVFDDRYFNMLKILDEIWQADVTWWNNDGFLKNYYDAISGVDIRFNDRERIKLLEDMYWYILSSIADKISLNEKLPTHIDMDTATNLLKEYSDMFSVDIDLNNRDVIKLITCLAEYIIKFLISERIDFKEKLPTHIDMDTATKFLGEYSDSVNVLVELSESDKVVLCSVIAELIVKMYLSDKIVISELLSAQVNTNQMTKIFDQYSDGLLGLIKIIYNQKVSLIDWLANNTIKSFIDEYIHLKEKLGGTVDTNAFSSLLKEYSDSTEVQIDESHNDNLRFELVIKSIIEKIAVVSKLITKDIQSSEIVWDIGTCVNLIEDEFVAGEIRSELNDKLGFVARLTRTLVEQMFGDDYNLRDEKIHTVISYITDRIISVVSDSFDMRVSGCKNEILKVIDSSFIESKIYSNEKLEIRNELSSVLESYLKTVLLNDDAVGASVHKELELIRLLVCKIGDIFVNYEFSDKLSFRETLKKQVSP